MRKVFLCTFLFVSVFSLSSVAQINLNKDSSLTLSGYVDVYYAHYTDSVGQGNFQKFPTAAPRSDAAGLNMAMISLKYLKEKVRAAISLHYGDIPLSAWSAKYNNIQEAYAGYHLSKKIWIDAGFFRTHTGAEGMPKENITSSVTVATYSEPYYEAGVKLNYKPSDKFSLDLYLLNGYNIYEENNKKKSFGLLATYAITDSFNIGYSNYIGDNSADSITVSGLRNFENIFLNYEKRKLKIQIAFDLVRQLHADTLQIHTANAYSGFATIKYRPSSKTGIYARGEFFNDISGFLNGSFTNTKNKTTGVKLWGITAGAEYRPTGFSYIRLEARQLQCDRDQQIFRWKGKNRSSRSEILLDFGCFF